MQIIDNLLIVGIHIACFIAGMKIANYYNSKREQAVKDALERQFLRLRAHSDADDPCKPYGHYYKTVDPIYSTGDYDGDADLQPISPDFMDQLKQTGQAKTSFRKSDLTKSAACAG